MRFIGGKRVCIEVCVDFIPRHLGGLVLGGLMTSSGGTCWRVVSRGLRDEHEISSIFMGSSSRVFFSRSSRDLT
jgi:hypothetical protein